MSTRAEAIWTRIEAWFRANLGPDSANLGPPASAEAFAAVEAATGLALPAGVREVYQVHDGDGAPPGLFGNWERFLSLSDATGLWRHYQDLLRSLPAMPNSLEAWREQVEQQIAFVQGPVKPLIASPAWFPITDANGNVLRFLDFDPAPGGVPGQVIQVDLESAMYQVVAGSLAEFLEAYAHELERGEVVVEDGDLRRVDETEVDPTGWGLPAYLR